jgi:NTP pyrophosphatase (non-canonical NTP hydrolase)
MTDKISTIADLKDLLQKFSDERDWNQFHDAKNLAEAISIEAAELQELFLWQDSKTVMEKLATDESFKKSVEEELADIVAYCLNFANAAGIDISSAVVDKVSKNAEKYPVEKAKGIAKKYDQL